MRTLTADPTPLVIMGDFNLPDVNWSTLSEPIGFSNQFCDLVFESNLLQLVDQPTHICGNILDLVLTNCHDCINSLTVHPQNSHFVSSDHYLVSFCISLDVTHREDGPTIHVYNFAKGIMMALTTTFPHMTFLLCIILGMLNKLG